MKSYFLCILASAVISALSVSLCAGKGFEKYIKYICALVCIGVTVLPVVNLFGEIELPEEITTAEISITYDDILENEIQRQTREYAKNFIYEKTGIKCTDVSIDIIRDGDTLNVGKIKIYISNGDSAFAEEISKTAESEFQGIAEVIVAD